MVNKLYCSDNRDVLRASIASESVHLVYLDPPFNSNAAYNVPFKTPDVRRRAALERFRRAGCGNFFSTPFGGLPVDWFKLNLYPRKCSEPCCD